MKHTIDPQAEEELLDHTQSFQLEVKGNINFHFFNLLNGGG